MTIDFTVDEKDNGTKLGVFLRRQGVSMSLLRSVKFINDGITINGKQVHTNYTVKTGEQVIFALPQEPLSADPQQLEVQAVYKSSHAIVYNKPAGMMTHPSGSRRTGTLANQFSWMMAQQETPTAFRPIGRLDAGTSGLVLCAANAYAAPFLADNFHKTYFALVQGDIASSGTIEKPLLGAPDGSVLQMVDAAGKYSRTEYEKVQDFNGITLVKVRPITGRTHQIRAHFASIGHPLIGDSLYGGAMLMQRPALHCGRLVFTEPEGNNIELEQPLPDDMRLLTSNT